MGFGEYLAEKYPAKYAALMSEQEKYFDMKREAEIFKCLKRAKMLAGDDQDVFNNINTKFWNQ